MYYYSFHIGDYRAATAHLTNEEDLAYRRLIDMYYDSESCIPLDTHWVSRRIRVAIEVVETVLKDMFERTENGWRLQRCEDEIATYQHNAEVNRTNGKLGGRPKKTQSVTDGLPTETESKPNEKATINHKPETINQEPLTNKKLKPNAEALDGFSEFWAIYDKKVEKPQAEKSWKRIKPSIELQLTIYDAARKYVQSTPDKKYRKNPSTWLNHHCWNDEVITETQQKKVGFFGQLAMTGGSNEPAPTPIAIGVDR